MTQEPDNSNSSKTSIFEDPSYLKKIYSRERRPVTDYPIKLAGHLIDNYYQRTGKILDVGCGRGDLLKQFGSKGFDAYGIDYSEAAIKFCKPHPVSTLDLETESFPFSDEEFDFIFSKSVVEHLRSPINMLNETHRVLAEGGRAVIMTPSWMHTHWGPFYLDHTHVTPFTKPSLEDAMNLAGFKDVRVIHFYQLPFIWKYPWLRFIPQLIAALPIPYHPMHSVPQTLYPNKFVRFSNEVMLLGTGVKKGSDEK